MRRCTDVACDILDVTIASVPFYGTLRTPLTLWSLCQISSQRIVDATRCGSKIYRILQFPYEPAYHYSLCTSSFSPSVPSQFFLFPSCLHVLFPFSPPARKRMPQIEGANYYVGILVALSAWATARYTFAQHGGLDKVPPSERVGQKPMAKGIEGFESLEP